jgi:hypothetical protein
LRIRQVHQLMVSKQFSERSGGTDAMARACVDRNRPLHSIALHQVFAGEVTRLTNAGTARVKQLCPTTE